MRTPLAQTCLVLWLAIDLPRPFRALADRLVLKQISIRHPSTDAAPLYMTEKDTGARARANRARSTGCFRCFAAEAPQEGGPQHSRAEVDGVQRYRRAAVPRPAVHQRTNQVQRSFEDTSLKQRTLDLIAAA